MSLVSTQVTVGNHWLWLLRCLSLQNASFDSCRLNTKSQISLLLFFLAVTGADTVSDAWVPFNSRSFASLFLQVHLASFKSTRSPTSSISHSLAMM
mmetsp:Transcript_374/g.928  ORF Transcript_374/g.928 Transcript_374/m.928 type:complete len:96 (+) Transcript_374:1645-1932(+)